MADNDGCVCFDLLKVAANDGTATDLLLASCFSWGAGLLLLSEKEKQLKTLKNIYLMLVNKKNRFAGRMYPRKITRTRNYFNILSLAGMA